MSRILVFLLPAFICTAARSPHAETKNEFFEASAVPEGLESLFGVRKRSDEDAPKRAVCDSDECDLIAQIMKASMNESADPCDDFYEYACGMWPEHNMIPETDIQYSLWSFVARDLKNRTKNILDREPTADDAMPIKLARKFYDTCMDVEGIEQAGLEPFLATISRIGGWPLIMEADEWSEEDFNWQKVDDYYARLVGHNTFYKVDTDLVDESEMEFIMEIDLPILPEDSWVLEEEEDDDEDDIELPPSEEVPGDSADPESEETVPKGSTDDEEGEDSDENEVDDDSNSGNSSEETDSDEDKRHRKMKKHKSAHGEKKKRSKHRKVKKFDSDEDDEDDCDDDESSRKVLRKHRKNSETRHKKVAARHRSLKSRDKAIKGVIKHIHNLMKMKRSDESSTEEPSSEEDSDEKSVSAREKYAGFIAEAALAISEARGDELTRENIEKDLQELVQFIVDIQSIMESLDFPPKNMTIEELQQEYDSVGTENPNGKINWYDKLSNLFNEANVEIEESMLVRLTVLNYLKKLGPLLDKTPSRTIVNYIHWNFLSRMLFTSTKKMRSLYYDWFNDEDERTEETLEKRDERCSNIIDKNDLIGYEYVRKYFTEDVRKSATAMVTHIQAAVREKVEKSDWLNEWGKNFVLEKLQNMKKIVGFPDWYKNKTAVNRYFGGLVIGPTLFENVLSYSRYKTWTSLQYLSAKTIDVGRIVNPLMLNAFYVPQFNAIAITAADLQNPLFGARRPATLNYGIIGVVLGHEVNHGFDGQGRKYDKSGKVTEWLSTMVQEYSKRADCFVEQYENYANEWEPSGKFKGYGNLTRDENIADTMGLEACYNALKAAEKQSGHQEATLPGFEDFNTDQLFFLSYANLWCGDTNTKRLPFMARFDEHSTAPLRVRGALSNMEAFAKAYNCPAGSAMNPEKKCNIWN